MADNLTLDTTDIATLRGRLQSARGEAGKLLDGGAQGIDAAHVITNSVDDVLKELFQSGLRKLLESTRAEVAAAVALIPYGGYGRRDLAPFSDVDLLILHTKNISNDAAGFLKHFVRDVWDVGLSLGQFAGTVGEVLRLARKETLTATALLEARSLLGPPAILADLRRRLSRRLLWGRDSRLIERSLAALRDEQGKFGSSVFLLEPDIKRSSGGLRDIHLLRWIGAIRFGHPDPNWLVDNGKLPAGDFANLERAHDLLLRVRAELHFHAGKAADVLHRGEQLRIARKWGYRDLPDLLAVEQFMREYFRRCTAMQEVVDRFVERNRPAKIGAVAEQVLFSRQVAPGVAISGNKLTVDDARLERILTDAGELLEVATLAVWHDVDFDAKFIDALRDRLPKSPDAAESNPSEPPSANPISAERFLNLLSRPGGIARTLRTLHRVGALERIFPEFEVIRCLLQFNAYHKYTVDEHTFIMLAHAEELAKADGLLGDCYRKIARKDLLHLAILLHDIGKGRQEDHSDVGARIADQVAQRLGIGDTDRDCLVFLVQRHLAFSNLAFHRDISDRALCLQLTRELGSVEMLRKLYVLTCVDTMAVGPGNFNSWRADILADLFHRCLAVFGEQPDPTADSVTGLRQTLLELIGPGDAAREFVEALGPRFLRDADAASTAALHRRWREQFAGSALTTACHHPTTNAVTYTVLTHEKICDGVFHRICGALAAHRLEVLSARIQTLSDGSVVDQFEVVDIHHIGVPTRDRIDTIGTTIRRVLLGELNVNDVLWSGRSSAFAPKRKLLTAGRTRIAVDNESSETCTVIDAFTGERRGVLYTLAKGIFRLGLSVQYAAISTYADECMDVFYVVEADGKKVQRLDRIEMIQNHLASDLARLATDPRSMGF